MADFDFEVTRWVQAQKEHAELVFRAIAWEAVNRVKQLTPVDTGFLRSNWTAIIKGQAEPVPGRQADPLYTISRARIGDVIVIVNPTEYARRIEYGFVGEDSLGRHFNQQGRHMMAQTIAELPAIADRVVARIGGA